MVRMTAHDSASREAVKQAIDQIIPIMNDDSPDDMPAVETDKTSPRVEVEGSSQKRRPVYPSVLKRLLQEEGLLSPVMILVMQMVVRNREAFYRSRYVSNHLVAIFFCWF